MKAETMATKPTPTVPPELNQPIKDAISFHRAIMKRDWHEPYNALWWASELTYSVMVNYLIEIGFMSMWQAGDLPLDAPLIINMSKTPIFAAVRAMILAGVSEHE